MKKIIIPIILIISACSKDDNGSPSNEACYVCTHKVTETTSNASTSTSSSTTACNLSAEEITNLEGSGTHTEISGGTTTATVTTCAKQ